MAEKSGFSGIFARNTGTYGTPTWTTVTIVRDLTITLEAAEADVSSRGSRFKRYIATLIEFGVELEFIYDPANASYVAMLAAAIANPPTTIEFAVADGTIATSGTQYVRFHAQVFGMGRSEPLEDGMTNSCMLKPTPNSNDTLAAASFVTT
jgi:hypothetical protein